MPRLALLVACLGLTPSMAPAAAHVVAPGETLTLKEDLVLKGDDTLEIKSTSEKPCTVVGNGRAIRSEGKWTGSATVVFCTLQKLGAAPKRAIRRGKT